MSDKRKHKRIVKRLETEFSSGHECYRGISSDISANGLFVRTSNAFTVGTVIDITLHLPDHTSCRLKGRVQRSVKGSVAARASLSSKAAQATKKNGMGIEIIERDHHFAAFVNTFLPEGERVTAHSRSAAHAEHAGKEAGTAPHKGSHQKSDDHLLDSMIDSLFVKRKEK